MSRPAHVSTVRFHSRTRKLSYRKDDVCRTCMCVQTMNILIVNLSIIDACASFFTLVTGVGEVDGTHMSRDSIYSRCLTQCCHVTGRVCHVTSPMTCSFVVCGFQDSRFGGFSVRQPTTFFSRHWNATLQSSIPSGTKPT